ncbi:beta-ketoacyl synthase [Aspergillus spectabilis]
MGFWEVLQDRRNLKSDWPSSRLDCDSSVSNKYSTVSGQASHFITEDVRSFDAPFFSVTAKEAASMDPLQRWALEVSYRALETAGIPAEKLRGSRTAVFAASILDQVFHVLRVAAGQIPAANIPIRISDAWFASSSWQKSRYIQMVSMATETENGSGELGSIYALGASGAVLCRVKSAVTAAVSGRTVSREEKQLLYSVEWKPHLSLLVPEQLQNLYGGHFSSDETSIVTDHAMLCDTLNLVTARILDLIDRQKVPATLEKHVKWMERHVRKRLTLIQRQKAVTISEAELKKQLSKVESVLPAWTLYTTCARKLPQILAGEIDPLQMVFESDQARVFYAHLFQTLCADGRLAGYLDLEAHQNPVLRILEVGAGTGGMTGHVLAALQEREARTGAPSFATYTYTDISPAFFEQARLRWLVIHNLCLCVGPTGTCEMELICYRFCIAEINNRPLVAKSHRRGLYKPRRINIEEIVLQELKI